VLRYIFPFVFILLLSCEDREAKVYRVPAEVQPFVESFMVEAASRGKRMVIDDLIIDYRYNIFTARAHAAGICKRRFGHTPVIHIDTTSANWKASAMSREQLVFHELCHCLLNRSHRNDTLLNGNFASIMKTSGETLYGPLLTAFKREYYIDELFDPATPSPAWAQINEKADTPFPATDTLFSDDFGELYYSEKDTLWVMDSTWLDSLTYRDWPLAENGKTRRWVRDGRFELESYMNGTYFVPFRVDLEAYDNFQIEVEMALLPPKGNMSFFWGGFDTKDLYSLVISHSGQVSIGISGQGTMFGKPAMPLAEGSFNQLIIRKRDCCYYFFLNGHLIDNMRFEALNGDLMGFGVSNGPTELWVERILITAYQNPL
jgi:hypothetical protein